MGIQERDWYRDRSSESGQAPKKDLYALCRYPRPLPSTEESFLTWDYWSKFWPVIIWVFFILASLIYAFVPWHLLKTPASAPRAPVMASVQPDGGKITLYARGNHFFAPATLNGTPREFMVDTGASYVAVSQADAAMAGIGPCRQAQMNTANGFTIACIGVVQNLQIGPYRLYNVPVAVHTNLSGPPLLGMSALEHFDMFRSGNRMELSFRH